MMKEIEVKEKIQQLILPRPIKKMGEEQLIDKLIESFKKVNTKKRKF